MSRKEARVAAMMKMAEDIANGNGPLDRIERFCRERGVYTFCEFVIEAGVDAPDLLEWAEKPGRGTAARLRGINARIAKVRREAKVKEGPDAQ